MSLMVIVIVDKFYSLNLELCYLKLDLYSVIKNSTNLTQVKKFRLPKVK